MSVLCSVYYCLQPCDKNQVCRNINQIKICMETGRSVILLNLESLYESLYDVLNQVNCYVGLIDCLLSIFLFHSIILNMEETDMLTLGFKLTG